MTRMIAFGDLVREDNRLIDLSDNQEYACGGVRLNGKGVFIREYKYGSEIKKKFVQHIVKENDIVYSTLFAKSGAFAVAEADVEGAILSEKFPTFILVDDRINLNYLKWFFRSGQLNRIASEQVTGMAAFSLSHLSKSKFLKIKVPLPSLDRQALVVNLCEESSKNANKIFLPIRKNIGLLKHLLGVIAEKIFINMPKIKMSEIGNYILRDARIIPGQKYMQITVAMNHRGLRLRRICDGDEIKSPGQCYVKEGDILFSRIDIRQGAIGFVTKELEGGVVTRDFPVFRLNDTDNTNKQFLRYAFMSPSFMSQAQYVSKGTTGRKKIKRPAFLELEIPWPKIEDKINAIKALSQTEQYISDLIMAHDKHEILTNKLGRSVIETLYAQDAGLI